VGESDRVTAKTGNAGLDAVRVLAAAMVVLCHVGYYIPSVAAQPWIEHLIGLRQGVMLFFVLSGYLLYRPFVRSTVDLRGYAIRRAARILPAYVLALIGISLLTGERNFLDHPLEYLLFLQLYDPSNWQGFLGVGWSLCVEVVFYLTLPLLALLIAGRLRNLMAFGGLLFLIAATSVLFVDPRWGESLPPGVLWCFFPGMAVAIIETRARWLASPLVLLLGLATLIWADVIDPSAWVVLDVRTAIAAFLLVSWAVERRPMLGSAAPVIAAAAAISYAVYLWHVDLIRTLGWPGVPAAVAVAVVSYVVLERPFLLAAAGRTGPLSRLSRQPLSLPRATSSPGPDAQMAGGLAHEGDPGV
jgi:peptidoglycan/LPS O-acetylase OafA/YrhL